jgi:hypothetical protein
MVAQLNALSIKAPRGGAWSLGQVQRVQNFLICPPQTGRWLHRPDWRQYGAEF